MIAHDAEARNTPSTALDLFAFARLAAERGLPAHEVEQDLWSRVLLLGREALGLFFQLQGQGDVGPEVALPDGSAARRLSEAHARTYRSVFGDFTLARVCYGSREGQAITFVPLDNRLQLPESDYSYLLQRWDTALGCESAFGRVRATLLDVLGVGQPVDCLERIHRHTASPVGAFRDSRPLPEPDSEGEVFVLSADGKGIPMRRGPDDPGPKAKRSKGDKANKKRMAVVGAIYSVDRHSRTPEEVVAALFRDPRRPTDECVERPLPVGKHLWARLSQAKDGNLTEPIDAVFGWQKAERDKRDPKGAKEVVCVMDGQEALWEGNRRHFGGKAVEVLEVLDLLHVTPRLWQAAHVFHKEGGHEAAAFVRARLLRVLRGEVKGVVTGLRRQGTLARLPAAKAKQLRKACRYLKANEERMRYGEYLAKGYPIASGVIEGACRHYVKDRMERSGMRWTRVGAQAMLDVRSEFLNGDWQAFQAFRLRAETARLYPHRAILGGLSWSLAA
jgi:hypothetical protein